MQKRTNRAVVRDDGSKIINEMELASRWDISHRTLQAWRSLSLGPIYLKLGSRIAYRMGDVYRYELESLRRGSGERVYG